MSGAFWRCAFRSRASGVWSLTGTQRQLSPAASAKPICVFKHFRVWCRYSVPKLWQQAVVGIQRRTSSCRLLFSGAVAFLWERERIRTEDAISCLKDYDDRVKTLLHVTLEESTSSTKTLSAVSGQTVTPSDTDVSLFTHRLHSHLQQNSDRHLSQLPLVGLLKIGLLSRMSMRALDTFCAVTEEVVDRLNEYNATAHLHTSLQSNASIESEDDKSISCEHLASHNQLDDEACIKDEVAGEATGLVDSMLSYYLDHSNQHLAKIPLVGLQPPGPIYSLTITMAGLCRRLFWRDSIFRSQALFLAHFGNSICDIPSVFILPSTFTELQDNTASLITEGFTAFSIRESLDSAVVQGKTLLTACMSPSGVMDLVEKHQEQMNTSPLNGEDKAFAGKTTDLYLAQCGWERFADAQNCTVYRKCHLSGLYMYKVIGGFSDISVKNFLDVQIDHACRKKWDGYIEKLETVDIDDQTGSEVVHWIMRFPFPMSSRDYLYVRRLWINETVAVLISRSVDHPAVPICRNIVRVQDYDSQAVMQPHTTTNEDGFEFELTYFDNPKTNLPSSCVNWVATAAMPDFLTKVHAAALQRKSYTTSHSSSISPV